MAEQAQCGDNIVQPNIGTRRHPLVFRHLDLASVVLPGEEKLELLLRGKVCAVYDVERRIEERHWVDTNLFEFDTFPFQLRRIGT